MSEKSKEKKTVVADNQQDSKPPDPLSEIYWPEKPIEEYSLAQGFKDELGFYTVYLPNGSPVLITSERKIIPVELMKLLDADITVADRYIKETSNGIKIVAPQNRRRWSVDTSIQYLLKNYLMGETVTLWELFQQILRKKKKFIWFYRNYEYHQLFLAAFAMYTYVYLLFDTCVYITLSGLKRSGKTRIMEVLNQLCFNAEFAGSISGPAIYRTIEMDRCTMLFDESDLSSKKGSDDPARAVVKSGYKRDGGAIRCEGDDNIPTKHSSYGAKVFASTKDFDDEILDRCVDITTERMPDVPIKKLEMEKLIMYKYKQDFQSLRNQCYMFGLDYFKEIREAYMNLETIEGIQDREEEIWSGLLAVCKVIDRYRLEAEPDIKPEDLLFNQMVEVARINKEAKDTDGAEDWQKEILEQTWEFIHLDGVKILGHNDWYVANQLRDYIRKNVEWLTNMGTKSLGKELKKCHVCPPDKEHRNGIKINGKNKHCYRITKDAMFRAGKRYGTSYYDEELQKGNNMPEALDNQQAHNQPPEQPATTASVPTDLGEQTADGPPVDGAAADKFCFGDFASCKDTVCELRDRCRAEEAGQ